MANKPPKKLPRKREIMIDLGEPTAVAGIVQLKDGSIAAVSPSGKLIRPKSATVISGYKKPRPDKPLKKIANSLLKGSTRSSIPILNCSGMKFY